MLDRHLIEQIEQPFGDAIADLVVGDDVEERHDFADVLVDALPHALDGHSRGCGVVANGVGDGRVVEQTLTNGFAVARAGVACDCRS